MIIDVRTEEEFNDRHVEGALNIAVSDIATAKMPVDFEEKVEVYCASGARAMAAKEILEKRGFTNVDLYNDGKLGQ
jgi:rhodanese-related sulfurtransferase